MARNLISSAIGKFVLAPAILVALVVFLWITGIVHDLQSTLLQVVIVVFCIVKRVRAESRGTALDKAVTLKETTTPPASNATVESTKKFYRISWEDEYGTATCEATKIYGPIALLDEAAAKTARVQVFTNSTGEIHVDVIRERHLADENGRTNQEIVSQNLRPSAPTHSELKVGWNLPVTYTLLAINIIYYLAAARFRPANLLNQDAMDVLLAGSSVGAIDEPWRFITPAFLHFSWWHILFNMVAVLLFGRICEKKLGAMKYLGVYFFCVVSSNLMEAALRGCGSNQAGASGTIMGLLGFLFASVFIQKTLLRSPIALKSFRRWFDVVLVATFFGFFSETSFAGYSIDEVGHATGFVSGVISAWIFHATNLKTRAISIALAVVVLCCSYFIARQRYFDYDMNGARGLMAMSRGQDQLAEEYLNKSIARENANLGKPAPDIFSKEWFFSLFATSAREGLSEDYNNAAWIADKDGKYGLANRLATAGLLVKKEANTFDTRAVSYMGLGDYVNAEADLLKALALKPNLEEAQFHLAQTMRLKGGEKFLRTRFPRSYRFHYQPSEWEYRFGRP